MKIYPHNPMKKATKKSLFTLKEKDVFVFEISNTKTKYVYAGKFESEVTGLRYMYRVHDSNQVLTSSVNTNVLKIGYIK